MVTGACVLNGLTFHLGVFCPGAELMGLHRGALATPVIWLATPCAPSIFIQFIGSYCRQSSCATCVAMLANLLIVSDFRLVFSVKSLGLVSMLGCWFISQDLATLNRRSRVSRGCFYWIRWGEYNFAAMDYARPWGKITIFKSLDYIESMWVITMFCKTKVTAYLVLFLTLPPPRSVASPAHIQSNCVC